MYGGATGSEVCRFEISASTGAMLDLRSLCISGTVFNLAAAPSDPASKEGAVQFLSPSLSGCLSSARVVVAGVEASSCDHIGRTEHVLSLIQSDDDRRAASMLALECKLEQVRTYTVSFRQSPSKEARIGT